MALITSKRIFYINTRSRLSGTDSNFTYSLPMPPNAEYDKACVLQCSIPKSYYLIEAGYNTFQLRENGSALLKFQTRHHVVIDFDPACVPP